MRSPGLAQSLVIEPIFRTSVMSLGITTYGRIRRLTHYLEYKFSLNLLM
jgi:hypothetical protein